ncbi:MAG TPA: hypothetical protein VNG32_01365 [Candidatus Dormibacteraeota bacterium]|nr:hypothetical protein [Candidatus Dormibacteraeota bacterium]
MLGGTHGSGTFYPCWTPLPPNKNGARHQIHKLLIDFSFSGSGNQKQDKKQKARIEANRHNITTYFGNIPVGARAAIGAIPSTEPALVNCAVEI